MPDQVAIYSASVLEGTPHGFLGRTGGFSSGSSALDGLNVGSGSADDTLKIRENRQRACDAVMPGGRLAAPVQVHSAIAITADHGWNANDRPEADAVVTATPGMLLGIVTADCAPVLLQDRGAGVIGAAHAGWRGAYDGVLEATADAMEALGARRSNIAAAIGPCIAQPSYEVDAAFRDRFEEAHDRFFVPGKQGHFQFDLAGFVADRLQETGITRVEALGLDTYENECRFYSYRRATHRGEPDYGRQFSLIGLPA